VSMGGTGEFLRLTQAEALRLILRIQPRSGGVPGATVSTGPVAACEHGWDWGVLPTRSGSCAAADPTDTELSGVVAGGTD